MVLTGKVDSSASSDEGVFPLDLFSGPPGANHPWNLVSLTDFINRPATLSAT